MTREMVKQIERDYWREKADPIDMAEIFDLAQKALEREPTTKNDCAEQNGCISCSLDNGDDCCRKLYEESMQESTTKNDLGVDCISRKAVIDELKRYFHDEYYQRTSIQDCRDCFIEDVLNHLPSVTPQEPKWIPVNEKLPDIHNYSENYLVALKRGCVCIGMFAECDGKHWWTYDDVVAWMSLPEPYKIESEDKE